MSGNDGSTCDTPHRVHRVRHSPSVPLLDQSFYETLNAKRSRHTVKHGSNSTHPVIFGIGTVECIVAVMRGSWSDPVLLSICSNCSLCQRQLHAAVWLRETSAQKGGREKRGRGVSFLIPGFCRACGESRDGDWRKKVSFLQLRKEGRVSASV